MTDKQTREDRAGAEIICESNFIIYEINKNFTMSNSQSAIDERTFVCDRPSVPEFLESSGRVMESESDYILDHQQ